MIERPELGAHGGVEVLSGSAVGRKELFHFAAQISVVAASLIQQRRPLFDIALGSAMEQLLDLRPAFRSKRLYAFCSSRCNHASAIFRSRRTVIGETSSACAISSVESPPK